MTTNIFQVGLFACQLFTGRDANNVGRTLGLHWVRQIVACADADNAEIWYLSNPGTPYRPFAVDCIGTDAGGNPVSTDCTQQ